MTHTRLAFSLALLLACVPGVPALAAEATDDSARAAAERSYRLTTTVSTAPS